MCLLPIHGLDKTMVGKVIRKRGEQWPNTSQFSSKVLCWIHTLYQENQMAARLAKGRLGLLSGHVCDQDVCKAIWERFCVVSLVRSWCHYWREVPIWSGWWLRWREHWQGSEWCHVVWSALWCPSMNSSEIPTGMGLAQKAQARASGSPGKQLILQALSSEKRL